MKDILLTLLAMFISLAGNAASGNESTKVTTANRMTITIGQKTFTATLEDNATATAFKDDEQESERENGYGNYNGNGKCFDRMVNRMTAGWRRCPRRLAGSAPKR